MGQALSYIPSQYQKEMAATRSRKANKNNSDDENVKSQKKNQLSKRTNGSDDITTRLKENKGIL